LGFHNRTNSATGGKEKISDINLVFESRPGNHGTVLINKLKCGNGVIDRIFAIERMLTEDGKFFVFWCAIAKPT